MELSRVVIAGLAPIALLFHLAPAASAQNAPRLSKAQRTALEAVVAAVDQAAADGATTPALWQSHVLRASSGAHYVALRATVPDLVAPAAAVVIYVRLAVRQPRDLETLAARSAVRDWLKGLRGDPLPMHASRAMSVPQGELPVGGAAVSAARQGDMTADSSNALRLQERERERAARDRTEREKQRRAELESAAGAPARAVHPFEDFDVEAHLGASPRGVVMERGLTAGPGDYDVFVAWAEPAAGNREPVVRVLATPLSLPAASAADFALSDIVVADAVRVLPSAYPVDSGRARTPTPSGRSKHRRPTIAASASMKRSPCCFK